MPAPKLPPPEGGFLFPKIAKAWREKAGVQPIDLARRLGVSPSAVTQYEQTDKGLAEVTLRHYANALEIGDFERALAETLIALRFVDGVRALGPEHYPGRPRDGADPVLPAMPGEATS